MKVSILAIAAAVAPGVIADFWLSYMKRTVEGVPTLVGGTDEGGVFHDGPDMSCVRHSRSVVYSNSADVSGKKLGMRIYPGTAASSPLYRDPLDVVEFNTGLRDPGHQTIYKDRGYGMFDLNGKQTGQCYLNRTRPYHLECKDEGDTISIEGSTMFFCRSELGATYQVD
ncbi:hypothetical protein F4805DRAFT_472039 [Annulohypoxylon moriforme]|nr:hypothetical protein F4805DRAFT_472039 [Annulohypoxylon moriforme]